MLCEVLTRSRSNLAKAAPNDPAHTARAWQTDRQTPRTSVTIVCTLCIRCSLKRMMYFVCDVKRVETSTMGFSASSYSHYAHILLLTTTMAIIIVAMFYILTYIFRAFEYFILVTIFANCVALAINTPYPMNDSDSINAALVRKLTLYIIIRLYWTVVVVHSVNHWIRDR